jgi:hypothetical protein
MAMLRAILMFFEFFSQSLPPNSKTVLKQSTSVFLQSLTNHSPSSHYMCKLCTTNTVIKYTKSQSKRPSCGCMLLCVGEKTWIILYRVPPRSSSAVRPECHFKRSVFVWNGRGEQVHSLLLWNLRMIPQNYVLRIRKCKRLSKKPAANGTDS